MLTTTVVTGTAKDLITELDHLTPKPLVRDYDMTTEAGRLKAAEAVGRRALVDDLVALVKKAQK